VNLDGVAEVPADDPDLTRLVGELIDELMVRYDAVGDDEALPSPTHNDARFVLLKVDEVPAACGALQWIEPDVAEVKRMYVAPPFRGQGLSRTVLAAVEQLARDGGARVVRLETGIKQPEAVALYESSGYLAIDPYGQYADDPQSRCFEKALY